MDTLTGKQVLVAGLGKTGQSVLPVLLRLGAWVQVADSRANPPGLDEIKARFPQISFHCGDFDPALFVAQHLIVASPGLAQSDPAFQAARRAGVPVLGDIELFYRLAKAPIIGITGSNGKSTVTTLVGEIIAQSGRRVAVGGNLGTPALDLLDDAIDWYVLELSSFQLELIERFTPKVGVILNLSEDHMDRYADFPAYIDAKARLFARMGPGETLILNADDVLTRSLASRIQHGAHVVYFGRHAPHGAGNVRILDQGIGEYFCIDGAPGTSQAMLPVSALQIAGEHNLENAMAALAATFAAGMPVEAMLAAMRHFTGLPHRMRKVAEWRGVSFYDDSKGTNVGATLKAILGLPGKVLPILGGDCKGADLRPLRQVVQERARAAILIGRDAPVLEEVLLDTVPLYRVASMEEAVRQAAALAQPGDQVLLSPACASLDMYRDYAERGRVFTGAVQRLVKENEE